MTNDQIVAHYEFQLANDRTLSDESRATMELVIQWIKEGEA